MHMYIGSLHQRFQYPSFVRDTDHAATEQVSTRQEEFRKLEEALASTFRCMEDLRGRLAPMEESAGVFRLAFGWRDARRVLREVRRTLHRGVAGEPTDSPLDRAQERTILGCLALAAALGGLGAPCAAALSYWVWGAAAAGFAAANTVLLLNFSRLSLPHVHRRLERQLAALSARRDAILEEIRTLQASSARAGKMHVRACVFLQSVNVLRNINYFVLCVKTETQRMALGRGGMQSQAFHSYFRFIYTNYLEYSIHVLN